MKMFELHNMQMQEADRCKLGVLVMTEVDNLAAHKKLDEQKRELESQLREKYKGIPRQELKSLHPMECYVSYYKQFGYTYHVLPQLESVVRGKSIPSVSPLVEAMFMAELKNMLLTAGHDLEKIKSPLTFAKATGAEHYIGINHQQLSTVAGDKLLADEDSIISSILKGPDDRTCIESTTNQVLYTVYAPQGIEDDRILQHLYDIESYVRSFSESARTQFVRIY